MQLTDEEYAVINQAIKSAADPEGEAYNMASAIQLGNLYGIGYGEARLHLDEYRKSLFAGKYNTPKSAFNAIVNSGRIGANGVKRGWKGTELAILESTAESNRKHGITGDTLTDNGIARLKEEIAALDAENMRLADYQPRAWWQEALKFGAQSAPFSGYVAAAGLLGSILAPGVGTAAAFAAAMQQAQGSEYIDLRNAGYSVGVSLGVSAVSGAIQGGIDTVLGNVPGLSKALGRLTGLGGKALRDTVVQKAAKYIFKDFHWGGVFKNAAAKVAGGYLREAPEEGLGEALQEMTSRAGRKFADWYAEEYEGKPNDGERPAVLFSGEAWKEIAEAFRGGFLGALAFGLGNLGLNGAASVKDALSMKLEAETNPTWEGFKKDQWGNPALAGMSDEKKEETLKQVYGAAEPNREAEARKREQGIRATADLGEGAARGTVTKTVTKDEEGNEVETETVTPPGAEYRTKEGRVWSELTRPSADSEGRTRQTIKWGDPTEELGRKEADDENRQNRDAYATYTIDGDLVTIEDFKAAPIRQGLIQEYFEDFASQKQIAGKHIVWNTKTLEQDEIKAGLIRANPRGVQHGLSWYTDAPSVAISREKERLVSEAMAANPGMSREHALVAFELTNNRFINALGKEGAADALSRVSIEAGKGNAALESAAAQEGASLEGKKGAFLPQGAVKAGRAFVYLFENGDASTINHEMFHYLRSLMNESQSKALLRAMGKDENTEWNNALDEELVKQYEAWEINGEAPDTELKTLFERMREILRSIYNTLRDRIKVRPELAAYFDALDTGKNPELLGNAERAAHPGLAPEPWNRVDVPFTMQEGPSSRSRENGADGGAQEDQQFNEERAALSKNYGPDIKGPRQEGVRTPEELRAKAEAAVPELREYAQALADKYGARIVERPTDSANPLPVKSLESIQRHLGRGEDVSEITDALAVTVVPKDFRSVVSIAEDLAGRDEVVQLKDRFKGESEYGYKDMLAIVKLPGGMLAEIQVNTEQMLAAKQDFGGHVIYEIAREMNEGDPETAGLKEFSKTLYAVAWRASLAAAHLSADSFEITDAPYQTSSSRPDQPEGVRVLSERTLKRFSPFLRQAYGRLWNSTNSSPGSSKSGTPPSKSNSGIHASLSVPEVSESGSRASSESIGDGAKKVKGETPEFAALRGKYREGHAEEGFKDVLYAGDEAFPGVWKLVEAEAPQASHDETTFHKTPGFPQNENGSSVNDRDYENNDVYRDAVVAIAAGFDGRAIEDPVIVSRDGVVVSGNNRTMSSKLAAKNGTDGKYIEALNLKAKKYGFTEGQIARFTHPRLVFEAEIEGGYTSGLFALFNVSSQKAMSPKERAVKMSRIITDGTVRSIAAAISGFETVADFYRDAAAVSGVIDALQRGRIIGEWERSQYLDEDGVTGTGQDFLETVLVGSILDEANIRRLNYAGTKSIRRKLVSALSPLVENRAMGEYSVIPQVNLAVDAALQAAMNKDKFKNVRELSSQGDMFTATGALTFRLAELFEGKDADFRDFLSGMNRVLEHAARGQADMFAGGVEAKEALLERFLKTYRGEPVAPLFQEGMEEGAEILEARRQFEAVKAAYSGNPDALRLAPNGERIEGEFWDENPDALVWIRTPNFKDYFGNWETLAQLKAVLPKIEALLRADRDTSKGARRETIGRPDARVVELVQKELGIDVSGYRHTIDKSEINHAFDHHGDPKTEEARGQIAITDEDIKLVPFILASYDSVKYKGKNKKGLDVLEYTKAVDGTIITIEEVRTGRKELAFDTMYKAKRGSGGLLAPSPFTSETTPEQHLSTIGEIIQALEGEVSKVVDKNGVPRPVFHGGDYGITEFKKEFSGANTGAKDTEKAFFFTSVKTVAHGYANAVAELKKLRSLIDIYAESGTEEDKEALRAEGERLLREYNPRSGYITTVFLNIKNPFEFDYAGRDYSGDANTEMINRAYARGYDGVIFKNIYDGAINDGFANAPSDVYAAFFPNQIKSATDNAGTFSGNPGILYQSIGETGAEALDRAEEAGTRMDNLAVARQMEEAGKGAKAVRLATGWERGSDGKWRYEIPDIDGTKITSWLIEHRRNETVPGFPEYYAYEPLKGKLGDWVTGDAITAYPQLKDIDLTVSMNYGPVGVYNPDTHSIKVSAVGPDGVRTLLAHEIQHAIQDIEGFAVGGNPDSIFNTFISDDDVAAWWNDKGGANEGKPFEELTSWQKMNAANRYAEEVAGLKATDIYTRLAGEVEARNAQTRLGMSAAERLSTLLADTEDVARDEQIILYDSVGALAMQEALAKTAQVVEIEPAKIVDEEGKPINVHNAKELKAWWKNNLVGSHVRIDENKNIVEFTWDKLKSSLKKTRDEGHNEMYGRLTDLVKKSIYEKTIGADEKHQGRISGQQIYYAAAKIGGQLYAVTIRIDIPLEQAGLKYKDHEVTGIKIEPSLYPAGSKMDGSQQEGSIAAISIGVLAGKVKPSGIENGVLFQTQEDLVKAAQGFDNWLEFMDFMTNKRTRPEGAYGPAEADAAWYRSFWESSRGIKGEAERVQEAIGAMGGAIGLQSTKDASWLSLMRKDGYAALKAFMDRTAELMSWKGGEGQEAIPEIEYLQDLIRRKIWHGSFFSNVSKILYGGEVSSRSLAAMLDYIRKDARDYRYVYAKVMGEDSWAVRPEELKSGQIGDYIADPVEDIDFAEERKRIAENITNGKLRQKVEDGSVAMDDPDLKREEKKTKALLEKYEAELSRLEKETEADFRSMKDFAVRQLLSSYERFTLAQAEWKSRSDKTAGLIAKGIKLTEQWQYANKQAKADYDSALEAFQAARSAAEIDGSVQAALERLRARAEIKEQFDGKAQEAHALSEVRRIKRQLVKSFNRKISFGTVAAEEGTLIIAMQRLFEPNMFSGVRQWVNDPPEAVRAVYSQWKTDAAYREELMRRFEDGKKAKRNAKAVEAILNKQSYEDLTAGDITFLVKNLPKADIIRELRLDRIARVREDTPLADMEVDDDGNLIIGEAIQRKLEQYLTEGQLLDMENLPFAQWTLEQMEELGAVVDRLYVEGRTKKRAADEARRSWIAGDIASLVGAITDTGVRFNPGDTPEERKRKKELRSKIINKFNYGLPGSKEFEKRLSLKNRLLYSYGATNMRRLARIIDGGKNGIATKLLIWAEDKAYNAKERKKFERETFIREEMKRLGVDVAGLEQAFTFDNFFTGYQGVEILKGAMPIGGSYTVTLDDLLFMKLAAEDKHSRAAAAHGNMASETEKTYFRDRGMLEEYESMTNARFNRVMDTLDAFLLKEENRKYRDFMDVIRKDYAEMYPRLNQASIDEFNTPVWRVKHYVPIIRQGTGGESHLSRMMDDMLGAGVPASKRWVDNGMVKKRIDIGAFNQSPVETGLLKTWTEQLERTEHFIAYAPYVRHLNAVFKGRDAQGMRNRLEHRWGAGALKYIDAYINEIANPSAQGAKGAFDDMFRALRGKTAFAYLAWKTSGVIKQLITSPAPFFQHLTPAEYARAAAEFMADFNGAGEFVRSKSIFMRNRVADPMYKLIQEEALKTGGKLDKAAAFINRANELGMKGLEMADWVTVAPGWLAAYRKALAGIKTEEGLRASAREKVYIDSYRDVAEITPELEAQAREAAEAERLSDGEMEEEAVKRADDIVRLTQPSNRLADIAPLFKAKGPNSEIVKAFLQFQTALNVVWQNIRYDIPLMVKQKQFYQAAGGVMAYAAAGIALGLVTQGLGGGDGGDDERKAAAARQLLYYSLTQLLDSVPVVSHEVSYAAERLVTGKGRYFAGSMTPVLGEAVKAVTAASGGKWVDAAARFGKMAAYGMGLPVSGANELWELSPLGDGDWNLEALTGRR